MFNVESPGELDAINAAAGALGITARVALRVNPDVDPKTHPYISTGLKKSKFGIRHSSARSKTTGARGTLPHIEVVGVDCHIGSQLTTVPPFVDALAARARPRRAACTREDFHIRYLDMGGGLGITYNDEQPPEPNDYAAALTRGPAGPRR